MHALDLRGDVAAAEYPALADLELLEGGIRVELPDLPRPIVLAWSDEPVLALDRGDPWLYGPVERDPMARDGGTVLPRRQRRTLAALAERGVPFQRLGIAHQLDPDGAVSTLLPVLRHGPRLCTDAVARAVAGPVPPHPGTARALRTIDMVLRGAGRAVAVTADRILDPVLFGVVGRVAPVHGEPCLWYPIAVWAW